MPFIKLTKIERKRVVVLVSCLLCACFAWLILALNNKYVYSVQTQLIYKDEPLKKAFKALQPDVVELQVEGTGWQLLFSRLRINPQSVSVSLQKLSTRNFVVFSEQLPQINKEIATAQKIISVKPDTLYFDFSKRTTKRVPIKLLSSLVFLKQYHIANQIQLKPAYVNISGPQEELAKITEWETDTLKISKLKQSTNTRVAIKPNQSNNIAIYPTSIGVFIPVDEFTEKTVEVALNLRNNTNFYDFKLYPKKIKVKFMVALSSYAEVDEDLIEASVDVNEWKNRKHQNLTVTLTRFPKFCKLLSIVPQKVKFIIEK